MCGLTGFWSFNTPLANQALERIVQAMSDQLQSRGPDSSGIWCDQKVSFAFAHRRLAIVDLSQTGHQPMVSSSERFVITYNGEVYNASEIRDQLISKGYSFRGTSDTEVILNAVEAYGVVEATRRLIGMFAFAIWDSRDKKLHLVRDRLGIKPLYWGIHQETLFFGSQLKSFYPHPHWSSQIDREILISYFRFGYVPGPSSIFKGIQKLSPGCIVTIEGKDKITRTSYWVKEQPIAHSQGSTFTSEQWIDQLEMLLKDAVKGCMVSDVPIGAFLSGGIDSSTVVALMQSQSARPVQTFSIGFEEDGYNEATHAAAVARHLGTDHHELYIKSSDALDIIPSIPEFCNEPFADSSLLPTYLVSRLARTHLKVCMSGDGGDELFAGYPRYFLANQIWNRISLLPQPLRKFMASTMTHIFTNEASKIGHKAHLLAHFMSSSNRIALYLKLISLWENPEELVPDAYEKHSFPWLFEKNRSKSPYIEEMQYIDSLTYLPDDILSKVDYASMAVSLESRVPLLDHRVVEFARRVPLELKIKHPQGKWILREVLKRYVPQALTERPKMGFGVPIDQWLRGPLRPWAEDLLSESSLKDSGLNPIPIRQRWAEHVSGTRNWHYSLWSVLMFQGWVKSVGN